MIKILVPVIIGASVIAMMLQAEGKKSYDLGFRNGTQEAYSHIDDNVCKPSGAK